MAKAFLSYSRSTRTALDSLASDLEGLGHQVWADRELTGGQAWWAEILEQIRVCQIFVFVLSPEALESVACRRELAYASALLKPILPVLAVDGVPLGLLPEALSSVQYVDYRQPDRATILSLARAVYAIRPPPALPDPLPPPPEIPVSYLGSLSTRIDLEQSLTFEQQSAILVDLRRALRNSTMRADARNLLLKLRARRDLLSTVADEIDDLTTTFFPNARPGSSPPTPVPLEREDGTSPRSPATVATRETSVPPPSPGSPMSTPTEAAHQHEGQVSIAKNHFTAGARRVLIIFGVAALAAGIGWQVYQAESNKSTRARPVEIARPADDMDLTERNKEVERLARARGVDPAPGIRESTQPPLSSSADGGREPSRNAVASNEIRAVRTSDLSGKELDVYVDYAYDGSHGSSTRYIYMSAVAQMSSGAQVPRTHFEGLGGPGEVKVGTGTSHMLIKKFDNEEHRSTQLRICIMSREPFREVICRTFPVAKLWR